ncbi:type II secretion system protein F [Agrococcus lahaulensis]|nr:type II secretion system protein F [Agrococcus lahaulensis]
MLAIGAGAVALGVGAATYFAVDPGRTRLPRERRRPAAVDGDSALAGAAEAATSVFGRLMHRRSGALATQLDLAGIRMRPQDFGFLVSVASVVLAAVVLVIGGGLLSAPAAAIAPLVAALVLRFKIAARRKQFGGQLDGTLQLVSSSLRAGHSMMQALASVAKESEEPTASELARVVNETRVGRPVVPALEEAAERMDSDDFRWAAQAIAINREVGGSLAEVLDGVAGTIRERGQIRRHVAALSAEGRLSAVILILLPFLVGGFLFMTNPGYLAPFVEHPLGMVLIVVSVIMLVVGGIWLRKVVEIEF